jgi:uncharacterized protein YndB with AHSA1/START domain
MTDRAAISEWLMPTDFAPRVGHRFQFRAKPVGRWNGIVDGEVLEIERPTRIVYSWRGGGPGGEKAGLLRVAWTLREVDGGTLVRLEHTGFRGFGGFILAKLILGPGWTKMMRRLIPRALAARRQAREQAAAG